MSNAVSSSHWPKRGAVPIHVNWPPTVSHTSWSRIWEVTIAYPTATADETVQKCISTTFCLLMAADDEDFYETTIRPKLEKLSSALRENIIHQQLLQERLLTDFDDQVLRVEKRTPSQRATYLLDLLKTWSAADYRKFCKIIWESSARSPAHRKVAQLLKLSKESVYSKPAPPNKSQGPTNEERGEHSFTFLGSLVHRGVQWVDGLLCARPRSCASKTSEYQSSHLLRH